ncbi:Hydroxyacylglutathione hydrolase [hydrothermal vent metagenome]|uniref:hydroxyacylglutathione hydrolase n=1 Tax=hydrothermal vent metagenome TaxID=652676 RepID=A0A3B1AJK9_9ZZZZ
MLTVQGIPAFDDNYIWCIGTDTGTDVALIDPGDAKPVITALHAQGLTPRAILITHHHPDHTGGIDQLVAHYGLPVFGPKHENIPHRSHPLGEGDTVELPQLHLQVMDVPGHTRGHIAFYRAADSLGSAMLFCGDTLFTGGCGRLFEGTPAQMQDALQRIRALPNDTLVYCAHEYTEANLGFAHIAEPHNAAISQRQKEVHAVRQQGLPTVPAPLGLEKATNPFLRWDAPELVRNTEAFAGRPLTTPTEVFAMLRQWKDSLD